MDTIASAEAAIEELVIPLVGAEPGAIAEGPFVALRRHAKSNALAQIPSGMLSLARSRQSIEFQVTEASITVSATASTIEAKKPGRVEESAERARLRGVVVVEVAALLELAFGDLLAGGDLLFAFELAVSGVFIVGQVGRTGSSPNLIRGFLGVGPSYRHDFIQLPA